MKFSSIPAARKLKIRDGECSRSSMLMLEAETPSGMDGKMPNGRWSSMPTEVLDGKMPNGRWSSMYVITIFLVTMLCVVNAQVVRLPLTLKSRPEFGLWATIPINGLPVSFLVDTGSAAPFVLDEPDLDRIRGSFGQAHEIEGKNCVYCTNISYAGGHWVKGHFKESQWLVGNKLKQTRFLLANEWSGKGLDGSRGSTVKALLGFGQREDSIISQWKYDRFSHWHNGDRGEIVFGVSGHPKGAVIIKLANADTVYKTQVYRLTYDSESIAVNLNIPWDTGTENTWFDTRWHSIAKLALPTVSSRAVSPWVFLSSLLKAVITSSGKSHSIRKGHALPSSKSLALKQALRMLGTARRPWESRAHLLLSITETSIRRSPSRRSSVARLLVELKSCRESMEDLDGVVDAADE
ncbi:hypothetical protein SELMODRAFT_417059 [Selaginella moellendorffii]|uniref:Peptidase A1 domain-containing protein n=1 Tax=Selaginella moellendorffii TaxID=88036 RepID=D8S184_SELML|nr:hypothetical protein SELMODRAFT_417059 [Selaginella moellendorffii]